MTKEEHALMVAMFAKQMQSIKILLQIMRSRDLITADDERAFEALVNQDRASNEALLRDAGMLYYQIATKMGIEIDPKNPRSS